MPPPITPRQIVTNESIARLGKEKDLQLLDAKCLSNIATFRKESNPCI
jgi:hypothetical protein